MNKYSIEDLRAEIDEADGQIKALFLKRMRLCERIGEIKKDCALPVRDTSRETEIIRSLTKGLTEKDSQMLEKLYKTIFEISKSVQQEPGKI